MLEPNAVYTVGAVIVGTGIFLVVGTTIADLIKPRRVSPLALALPGLALVIVGALVFTVSYINTTGTKEGAGKKSEDLLLYVPLTPDDKLSRDAVYALRNLGKLVPQGRTVSVTFGTATSESHNTTHEKDLIAEVHSLLAGGGIPKSKIKVTKHMNSKYNGYGVYLTLNPQLVR